MKNIFLTLGVIGILAACAPETTTEDVLSLEFNQIQELAKGSVVNFYMWGGSPRINAWVDSVVGKALMDNYEITLNRVPMDASEFINKLLGEKLADKQDGSIDLVWINGENFRRAKTEGLLFGPYAERLPNFSLVDPVQASLDFGFPTEGFETPWGKAQFVMEYDTAVVQDFPGSFAALEDWVRANPGLFTYPEPPDFTGSAFIRQAFYELTGGFEQYLDGFDQTLFESKAPELVDYLNRIKPYLWQEGRNYPSSKAQLDGLFEKGEVLFNLSYTQSEAQGKINDGVYPTTVRTSVMEGVSISNIHFTAIPFNSPNKAGAMVLANTLMSPEMQLSKNDPANWGDFTILDMSRLDSQWQESFASLDLGEATLPLEVLGANAAPEISADYVEALESLWKDAVLRQ